MILVYLDEFGDNGPYFGRDHAKHNCSPMFGLAGVLLPENAVREFGSFFLRRKSELLASEIERSGKPPYAWEKKGTNLFTAKSIALYPEIRRTAFRTLSRIERCGGKVFYCGREKRRCQEDVNANGLYKTVLAQSLRLLNAYCESVEQRFVVVLDENSARKALLETAAKTMFGADGVSRLVSPPFEVESYLDQNMQAADWIATLVGRLWNFRIDQEQFANYARYDDYFSARLDSVAMRGSVLQRRARSRVNQAATSS